MEEQNGVKNSVESPIMLRNAVSETVELPIQVNNNVQASRVVNPAPVQPVPTQTVPVTPAPTPVVSAPAVAPTPVLEKKEKEPLPAFLIGLMATLLIATFLFSIKFFEPANTLVMTAGILNYPFTFLITAIICKRYSFKVARKSIFISGLLFALFILIMMLSVIPSGNDISMQYNAIVQYLFANNQGHILGMRIFYPTLGQFFGVLISFIVSHLLYATVYNAVRNYTIDYLSVGLSLFIGYIIDRILFVFLLFAKGLHNGDNTFDFVIKVLTTEFMASIVACLIIIILYSIINAFSKKKRAA